MRLTAPVFTAANDNVYTLSRHRTLPIPATITPVANYPAKLRIYQTNASPYWQVRCFFKGKTHTQSLKTTNKQTAIHSAKYFYHLKVAELYGTEVVRKDNKEYKFRDAVDGALAIEQARTKRGDFSVAGLRILQNRITRTILPFFGDMVLAKIGYTQLNDFVAKMSMDGLSSTTIQQHLVATRKILTHAYTLNLIPAVPKFPTIKTQDKPRGSFTLQEYRLLVRTAKQNIGVRIPITTTERSKRGEMEIDRYAVIGADLAWLIRFMVNGFVRPSDIKNLKHKHITVVRNQYIYLRMNLPESKRHDKPIVTLQSAVGVYEKLRDYYAEMGLGKSEDYLFMPQQTNRAKALEFLGWQFKHIQALAGIGSNVANQQKRTLYSLRHTAITFRLLYGEKIDLLTLARNARTSVEMIEKFYSSNLSAEMNIDLIQGRR